MDKFGSLFASPLAPNDGEAQTAEDMTTHDDNMYDTPGFGGGQMVGGPAGQPIFGGQPSMPEVGGPVMPSQQDGPNISLGGGFNPSMITNTGEYIRPDMSKFNNVPNMGLQGLFGNQGTPGMTMDVRPGVNFTLPGQGGGMYGRDMSGAPANITTINSQNRLQPQSGMRPGTGMAPPLNAPRPMPQVMPTQGRPTAGIPFGTAQTMPAKRMNDQMLFANSANMRAANQFANNRGQTAYGTPAAGPVRPSGPIKRPRIR